MTKTTKSIRSLQTLRENIQEWNANRKIKTFKRAEVPNLSQFGLELSNISEVGIQLDHRYNKRTLDMQLQYNVVLTNFPDTMFGAVDGISICDLRVTLRKGRKKSGEWYRTYTLGETELIVRFDKEDPLSVGFYMGIFLMSGLTPVYREIGSEDNDSLTTMKVRVNWNKEPTKDQVAFKNRVVYMIQKRLQENGKSWVENATREFFVNKPELKDKEPPEIKGE